MKRNPAVSERQRRFMCSELGRLREGKKRRTTMTESQLRDFCMKKRKKNSANEGYYVMKWGGGRYTSVAWFPTKADAQREVDRIKMVGAWSGMPPKIESSLKGKYTRNPVRVISDRQALALTKKVIAYGKRLLAHERSELRQNPVEGEQVHRFIEAIKKLDKFVVGSRDYIETLAQAYEHLKMVKRQMR